MDGRRTRAGKSGRTARRAFPGRLGRKDLKGASTLGRNRSTVGSFCQNICQAA
jgi:hypothetical protein